jgi:transglutaminase-like putative cysteine protease
VIDLGLCVALMAATSWAVQAAGWVDGGGAVVVGVAAVLEAALLTRARAPRVVMVLTAPVLAVVTIVPATLAVMPVVPHQGFVALASRYLRAVFTGLGSPHGWDFTVGLCVILFLCGYWLGWMALHEHHGVLAVVPAYSLLAVAVLNVTSPAELALPVTLAIALSLAVIAAAHLGSLDARWGPGGIIPLEGLGRRFTGGAAPVVAGVTVVALVLPAISTTDFSTRLFSQGSHPGAPGESGTGSGANGTTAIGFNLTVNLGGALVNEPKPVLTYRTDTGAGAYLQVATDTEFDRGNWYAPGRGTNTAGGNPWGSVPFPSGPLPRDTNILDGGIGSDEQLVHVRLDVDQGATGDQQLAAFSGEPDAVNYSGTAFGTISEVNENELLTVDSVQLDPTSDSSAMQTAALVSTATAAQLSAAGTNYPAWTLQYTELNDDGSQGAETIRSLADQWTSGVSDPYDEAVAIEDHLRDPAFFQYTLDPPADRNPKVWPLVFFLTTSHRGYCQYFASAMGAMLRSLDIPTRLVTGYGPGTPASAGGIRPRAELGEWIVTSSDAHTWVEAYFPNYGWIPFEPTPPSAQGDYEPFPRGHAAVAPAVSPPSIPTPRVSSSTLPTVVHPSPKASRHTTLPVAAVIAIATLSGLAGLVVVALLWFALPRSVASTWRRVETLGVIYGLERRSTETHRAFALRLGRSRPRAGPAFDELAVLTGRAEFSAVGTSVTDGMLARRTWHRALVATLPRRTHNG